MDAAELADQAGAPAVTHLTFPPGVDNSAHPCIINHAAQVGANLRPLYWPTKMESTMSNNYYTLVTYEHNRWSPQFGDYSRKVVEQERVDSYSDLKRSQTKVICTNAGQADIDAFVAHLNGD